MRSSYLARRRRDWLIALLTVVLWVLALLALIGVARLVGGVR